METQHEDEDLAAIQDGLKDVREDRTHPLEDVDAELRSKHGLAPRQ